MYTEKQVVELMAVAMMNTLKGSDIYTAEELKKEFFNVWISKLERAKVILDTLK